MMKEKEKKRGEWRKEGAGFADRKEQQQVSRVSDGGLKREPPVVYFDVSFCIGCSKMSSTYVMFLQQYCESLYNAHLFYARGLLLCLVKTTPDVQTIDTRALFRITTDATTRMT